MATQPALHHTTHAQCFMLAPPPPCMRILLHLHRTARPSRSAAYPTGTAQMYCILTLCAPPGCRAFFAASRGAVGSGAHAQVQVRTYFLEPIFTVSAACHIHALRVVQQLISTRPELTFWARLINFGWVRAQGHGPACHTATVTVAHACHSATSRSADLIVILWRQCCVIPGSISLESSRKIVPTPGSRA